MRGLVLRVVGEKKRKIVRRLRQHVFFDDFALELYLVDFAELVAFDGFEKLGEVVVFNILDTILTEELFTNRLTIYYVFFGERF